MIDGGARCTRQGAAIIHRIRGLETVHAPDERVSVAVEAIRTARRKRLGADYKEIEYPPGSFDGCHTRAARLYPPRPPVTAGTRKAGG